jgi:hypothetical protein
MTLLALISLPLVLAAAEPPGTLDSIRAEADLIKRHERALLFSEDSLRRAKALATTGGTRADLAAALADFAESAELSLQALRETGKPSKKLTKHYKRGELKTRDFTRKADDLLRALPYEDRDAAEKIRDRVAMIHEEYLLGVMGQK